MSDSKPSHAPMAGGFLMAGGTLVGAIAGAAYGQSSLGFLLGLGLGALGALAIWWRERGN
jgi:hypothetical protein